MATKVSKKITAIDILQEFYEDVRATYGIGRGNKLDSDSLDWLDLEKTYYKAAALLHPNKWEA